MRMRLGLIPALKVSDAMSPRERQEYHERRAAFAKEVWMELLHLEKTLYAHTCSVEAFYFYQGRLQIIKLSELQDLLPRKLTYLRGYSTRMLISDEYSRYVPLPEA